MPQMIFSQKKSCGHWKEGKMSNVFLNSIANVVMASLDPKQDPKALMEEKICPCDPSTVQNVLGCGTLGKNTQYYNYDGVCVDKAAASRFPSIMERFLTYNVSEKLCSERGMRLPDQDEMMTLADRGVIADDACLWVQGAKYCQKADLSAPGNFSQDLSGVASIVCVVDSHAIRYGSIDTCVPECSTEAMRYIGK